jgi:hypothetical protein
MLLFVDCLRHPDMCTCQRIDKDLMDIIFNHAMAYDHCIIDGGKPCQA